MAKGGEAARYATDLTDEQWEIARPFVERAPGAMGAPSHVDRREVVNALLESI